MRSMVRRFALTAVVCGLLAGCGNPDLKKMNRPAWVPKTASWPALTTLATPGEGMPGLERLMTSDNPAQINHLVNLPKFKSALDEFEQTPVPQEFANADRDAAKTEVVTSLRQLQKSVLPQDQAMKLLTQFSKSYNKLIDIPNQKRPEGEQFAEEVNLEKIK